MIEVILKESEKMADLSKRTIIPLETVQHLDTSLDSGTLNYLITEPLSKDLNEALATYSLKYDGNVSLGFVGIDSRALVRRKRNVIQTATQIEMIQTRDSGYRYFHRAEGEIPDVVVEEIIAVKGNLPDKVTPTAYYDNLDKSIYWNAEWTDGQSRVGQNYEITVTYETTQRQGVYSHQVALTEPSKLLQGVMIDGFGVTQPEEYNSRKTLLDVIVRLLEAATLDGKQFILTKDTAVVNVMRSVKSPEFKWNTQTTLWECLIQVGAVVDAIPSLIADTNGDYTVVEFDLVNTNGKEATDIADLWTNADGENIEESQYNTALSSIVENLREN